MDDQSSVEGDPRDLRIQELEAAVRERDASLEQLRQEVEELRARVPPDVEPIVKEVRRRFTQFIVNRVNPGFMERHHGDLSSWTPEIFQEAGELGLIGFGAPEALGGEGRDPLALGILLEELAKLIEDPGFLMLTQINKNWATLIGSEGREDLIERYARPMIQGQAFLAWAIWEPADPAFMSSVAKKVDGGWILNAKKPFVMGGAYATVFAVALREEASGDAVLFLVEAGDRGVDRAPVATVGARHIGVSTLTLNQVKVPDDRVLFDTDALGRLSPLFSQGTLNAAAMHVGWMQRMLGLCIDSLRPKVRGGMSVLDIPHVQGEIGRLQMGIDLARGMFLRTLEQYRRGDVDPSSEPLASTLKHFVTERTIDTAHTLMTLQGAPGYMDDNPWGRYLTHVLCLIHVVGSQDLLPLQLGARFLAEWELKKLRRFTF